MENSIKKPIPDLKKDLINAGKNAWGGIGGSGKHALDLAAELGDIVQNPKSESIMSELTKKAWGGIGGSGKHALDLAAEIVNEVNKEK